MSNNISTSDTNISNCGDYEKRIKRVKNIDHISSTSNEVTTSFKDEGFLFVCEKNYTNSYDENNFTLSTSNSKCSKQEKNLYTN